MREKLDDTQTETAPLMKPLFYESIQLSLLVRTIPLVRETGFDEKRNLTEYVILGR